MSPLALLDVLATMRGSDLAQPGYVEHRDRRQAAARIERTIAVLGETA